MIFFQTEKVFRGCTKSWNAFSQWNPSNGGLDYLRVSLDLTHFLFFALFISLFIFDWNKLTSCWTFSFAAMCLKPRHVWAIARWRLWYLNLHPFFMVILEATKGYYSCYLFWFLYVFFFIWIWNWINLCFPFLAGSSSIFYLPWFL